MADERRRSEDVGLEQGAGLAYQAFVQMENLLDKFKLLHYEESFCQQLGFKPFSRHYFALPTNSGEQFYSFTSIAAWLLQMSGKHFEQPQEFDDPNATIASILEEVRQFGHSPDFPPNKLKTGSGEQCIWVLDRLSDEALKAKNFAWKKPIYPEEELDEENIIEDDNNAELDLTLHNTKDEIEEDSDFEDEENIIGLDDLSKLGAKSDATDSCKPDVIMESSTDAAEWKLEVERVLPQLKITARTDNKDWRVHVEQMHVHQSGIDSSLKETHTYLDKLYEEITRTLEKIGTREKYLNSQLEQQLGEFRTMQDQLAETKEKYRQGSGGVTERTRTLAEVTEELDHVKMTMDERGSSMTDGTPLVKVKQAIQKLKQETTQMDIRIGVVQHILLQAKLREKINKSRNPLQDMSTSEYESF